MRDSWTELSWRQYQLWNARRLPRRSFWARIRSSKHYDLGTYAKPNVRLTIVITDARTMPTFASPLV